jgi:hypothetical protein
MNLQTVRAATTIVVIEAVALNEKVVERTCGRGEGLPRRLVNCLECCATAGSDAG